MSYQPLNLNTAIHIDCIYTIHYFEYASDFTYKGERHDFWEFCYVDKGEIEVMAGKQTFLLKQGEVIFHEPNEFHSLKAANRTAPNIAVVSFGTHDAAMRFFAQRIFTIDNEERSFLANVINEARLVLDHPLNIPGQRRLYKKENIPFGAEQLTQMFIEMFLLHLQRRMLDPALLKLNLSTRTKENADEYIMFKSGWHTKLKSFSSRLDEKHFNIPLTLRCELVSFSSRVADTAWTQAFTLCL